MNTPSLGEFNGYYNISKRDFGTPPFGTFAETVLNLVDDLPDLSDEEWKRLATFVRRRLYLEGLVESTLCEKVRYLWPESFFAIDTELVDRTLHVWFSGSEWLQVSKVLDDFRSFLGQNAPLWRIVFRFPSGDAPDIVIYPSIVRLGDGVYNNFESLRLFCSELMISEKQNLTLFSKQFRKVNNSTLLSSSANQNVSIIKHFDWSLKDGGGSRHTLWFVEAGFSIISTSIGAMEYKPSSTTILGLFSDGVWQLSKNESANSRLAIVEVLPIMERDIEIGLDGFYEGFQKAKLVVRLCNRSRSNEKNY